MIPVDRVYKTVLTLGNSDIRGNITPSDIRLLINDVVNEIYEAYFYDENRLINRQNRGLINGGLENIVDHFREKINHYSTDAPLPFVTTRFQFPANLRYVDSLYFRDSVFIEPCKDAKQFNIISNNVHTAPNLDSPIYLLQGTTVKISPSTIQSDVTIYYLRKPLVAKWTFIEFQGAEIFNPSAADFQDIDMHPSEENIIVMRTLLRMGISIKEEQIQAVAQNTQAQEFNQENSN